MTMKNYTHWLILAVGIEEDNYIDAALIVHKEEFARYIAMPIVALELYITPD